MNYRHAFHAGNHTEVFKHAVLTRLLLHLLKKPKPFMVLDTHAGIGAYDLAADEASRTGEAADGIGRVIDADLTAVGSYLDLIRSANPAGALAAYPGSPAIIASLLRPEDRLVACELHPDDYRTLRARFHEDRRVAIHHRDGYEAIGAFLPPPERRGLVFIDPPYEVTDEAARLGKALVAGWRKWPTGIFAAWYPVKSRATIAPLFAALDDAGIEQRLVAEFLRYPEDGVRLAGGGLVIVNPPWQLDADIEAIKAELAAAFAASDATAPAA